ncbi:MAG TPA: UDP-N-acetylmuramate dehydrogenase [Phycisphaerae bacterium]|nr:UDP-N-acetylmuramate dehydrogenase [Phycisphaerae bacterium]HOJ55643.1 UDP-N-acetylmuramate dehydrogenase [Phycisphaerae bacterium]HQE42834.1 UDP-N-acetylmuramate dehydrogenase [Phycisphaerae bacterium]
MSFLADFGEIVRENQPLAPLTYFGVGGPARWMVSPRSVAELAEVVRRCRQEDVDVYVLGAGANLLVSDDGVDGVVIRLNAPAFRKVAWERDRDGLVAEGWAGADLDGVAVKIGAGLSMARLTLDSVERGLAGLECMAGIPGSLGGIIRMNAGGRFGQISDVVSDVTVLDETGQVRRLGHGEVGFTYRHTKLNGSIVVGATLVLRPDDADRVKKRYEEIWDYKKRSQPLADYSAGCIFKNPPNDSAGRLIDQAGLKGHRIGGASVSEQHGNFIVASKGAQARDVLSLIGTIRRTVAERFGVELELEVQIWDRCGNGVLL